MGRYQELSDRGVPRFPSFVRVQNWAEPATPVPSAAKTPIPRGKKPRAGGSPSAALAAVASSAIPGKATQKRRFEFRDGKSEKFWEVSVSDGDVTVCFGRIGTAGQTQTKSFESAAAAQQHADKLVAEKEKKGYYITEK